MLEPLGQSQVIAYLERLSDEFEFHIVSFEKRDDWNDQQKQKSIEQRLGQSKIHWHPLRYHKSPSVPATLFDITQGMVVVLWLCVRHRINMIHARSYIPALIGLIAKKLCAVPLLFDMRGLWPDERVDGGIWKPESRIYRVVKWLEQRLLLGADHIVTLTNSSIQVIREFAYMSRANASITVIPTCANLDLFAPDPVASKPKELTLGYLGSVGTWYLFDEVLECFKIMRRRDPATKLLVVNRNEHALIRAKIAGQNLPDDCFEITSAEHSAIPGLIRQMSVGAAIIKPVFSKIASAPTKLAEYLGCGVPCIGNSGVGDMLEILEGGGAGIVLTDFSPADREAAVDRLFSVIAKPDIAEHCRSVALKHFSLEGGVAKYNSIYRGLLA
jgi:glycosyltransferase involved in cell wall biosynthesis